MKRKTTLADVLHPAQKLRREKMLAAGLCINETLAGTHGKATHGTLCKACRAKHNGVPIESLPDSGHVKRRRNRISVTFSRSAPRQPFKPKLPDGYATIDEMLEELTG
jgi:hypothetical protein